MSLNITSRCLLTVAAIFVLAAAGSPMTDEDVVRLYVSGTDVADIIDRIKSSEVEFDLSEEMLEELRLAGLPSKLIEAMNAATEIRGRVRPLKSGRMTRATLRIRINPSGDGEKKRLLRVVDLIDDGTYESLKLRTAAPTFTDMAIFVACRTQDHVPDQWRGKSPLGRDFINAPRHRMLYFLPGAELVDLSKWKKITMPRGRSDALPPDLLELRLPPEIEVELEPSIAHDLTLGIAMRTEERYYTIAVDHLDGLLPAAEEGVVDATVEGGKDLLRGSLKVSLEN